MTSPYILTGILICMSISTVWAGGGWTQPRNTGYIKLNQSIIYASQYYQPDGTITDITTTALYTTSIYAEYGITDRLTGILYFPFFARMTVNEVRYINSGDVIPGDAVNALSDTDVTLKYGLIQNGPLVLSTSLTLGLPLGVSEGGESGALQTGDGEFNQLLKVETSSSFSSAPLYVTATVGFNNRTKGFSEEFHFGVEVGVNITSNLLGLVRVYGVESFKNGDPGGTANGVFSNNMEYLSIAPELNYNLNDKYGLSAQAAFAVSGERILAAPNYSFGVFMKF